MADTRTALENLERAHAEFTDYLTLPVNTRRDKAGVIQAFEFTFELFWKTFQKIAPQEGLEATTPRQALQAGKKMGFISSEEAPHWSQMLRDRNLTSHVYHQELANEIFARIANDYADCFILAIKRLRSAQV